jgi:hypothetical protein
MESAVERTRKWALVVVIVVVAGGGVAMSSSKAEERPASEWMDPTTGEIFPDKMPSRIKIGTDLFEIGYGWLESANFQQPADPGPFMIYETEDSTEPAYWYYKDDGIVPIGAEPSGKPLTSVVAETAGERP